MEIVNGYRTGRKRCVGVLMSKEQNFTSTVAEKVDI